MRDSGASRLGELDMNIFSRLIAVAAAVSLATPAIAGPKVVIHPVQTGLETARYAQGMVMLDLERERGAVQVIPLGLEHGSLTFDVVVFNDGDAPSNFDIGNVSAVSAGQTLGVFSKDELVKKAENRAMWSQIGVALLAGAAAAASASQRDNYRSTLVTPRGVYSLHSSAPSAAGQAAAAGSVLAGGVAITSIQNRLDDTRAQLNGETVQMTTVDPGTSYGGRIVLHKIKRMKMPLDLKMMVRWNGEEYPFTFRVAKPGTPAPEFTALTVSSRAPRAAQAAAQVPIAPTPAALEAAPVAGPVTEPAT